MKNVYIDTVAADEGNGSSNVPILQVEESMSEGRYWAICLKPLPDRIL